MISWKQLEVKGAKAWARIKHKRQENTKSYWFIRFLGETINQSEGVPLSVRPSRTFVHKRGLLFQLNISQQTSVFSRKVSFRKFSSFEKINYNSCSMIISLGSKDFWKVF